MQYQKKINGIVRHMDDFKTSIPFFTSQVWKDLSKEFNNAWDALVLGTQMLNIIDKIS